MKKVTACILCAAIGVLVGAAALLGVLRLCDDKTVDAALGAAAPSDAVSSAGATSDKLTALAYEAAGYLKNRDYAALAQFVHPSFGVVFSPGATIDLRTARCFTPQQVVKLEGDSAKYLWGTDDEGPIELTVEEYLTQYACDRDYCSAPVLGIDQAIRRGNSLDNTADCFPNCRYVEFCYPGTAEQEYCDWSSLRLVFEDYQGEMKLTAVIHSEYTI